MEKEEEKKKSHGKQNEQETNEPQALPASAFLPTEGGQGARSQELKAEDEKALYSRLNIQGLLSKVLLRPGAPIKAFHLATVEDDTMPLGSDSEAKHPLPK